MPSQRYRRIISHWSDDPGMGNNAKQVTVCMIAMLDQVRFNKYALARLNISFQRILVGGSIVFPVQSQKTEAAAHSVIDRVWRANIIIGDLRIVSAGSVGELRIWVI